MGFPKNPLSNLISFTVEFLVKIAAVHHIEFSFFRIWSRDCRTVQTMLLCTKSHQNRMIFVEIWRLIADDEMRYNNVTFGQSLLNYSQQRFSV